MSTLATVCVANQQVTVADIQLHNEGGLMPLATDHYGIFLLQMGGG